MNTQLICKFSVYLNRAGIHQNYISSNDQNVVTLIGYDKAVLQEKIIESPWPLTFKLSNPLRVNTLHCYTV